MPPATGATSWRTRASRTTRPPAVMNELFVNIKVDREERPDIDAIYMGALHRARPAGRLAADHVPRQRRAARSGAARISRRSTATAGRRSSTCCAQSRRSTATSRTRSPRTPSADRRALTATRTQAGARRRSTTRCCRISPRAWCRRRRSGARRPQGAPKFPQWSFFWLLWRGGIRYGNDAGARRRRSRTLDNICQGGIYDHLGGGFARYSVDERWLVPHFEKMLYDNALLIELMTEVWRETRIPLFKTRIAETVAWLEREMIAEGGGFAASLDADSEGEEGKFYVWTRDEIAARARRRRTAASSPRSTTSRADGNWEGHTILNRLSSLELRSDEEEAAPRGAARQAARRARQAHASRLGRQGAGRLERADDRRAGARRASCSIGPIGCSSPSAPSPSSTTRMTRRRPPPSRLSRRPAPRRRRRPATTPT